MNWGILGAASIAEKAIIPAINSVEGQKLLAIASRTKSKAAVLAEKFNCEAIEGYEQILNRADIDAVYVPLPNHLHFEWAKKALENNKHVLVEKPAAINASQAKVLAELAKEKNLAILENFQFQKHSQNQFVKNLVSKGEIGEIRSFRSSFGFPPFDRDNNIRYKKELAGGALLDAGAYVLKIISFFLGNNFKVTSSFLNWHEEYDVDWYGGAFLINKETGIFCEVAFGFDNFYQCNYEIWGSKGKITVTRAFTAKPNFAPTVILEKQGGTEEIVLPKDNHFNNMISYFNEVVNSSDKKEKERNAIVEQADLIDNIRDKAFIFNPPKL